MPRNLKVYIGLFIDRAGAVVGTKVLYGLTLEEIIASASREANDKGVAFELWDGSRCVHKQEPLLKP